MKSVNIAHVLINQIKCLSTEVEELRNEMEGITVRGKHCPKPIKTWAQCGVSKKVMEALKK